MIAAVLVLVSLSIVSLLWLTQKSNTIKSGKGANAQLEPPYAPSLIPYIGHAIGLSQRKFEYYVELSYKIAAPIFTLPLPGQKMYIVTSSDLIQQVQKQPKVLSFTPIESKFSVAICDPSSKTVEVLNNHLGVSQEETGVHVDTRNAMREGTAPGPEVDQMNRDMIREIACKLDSIAPSKGQTGTLELYKWLKDILTIATTNAVYGPYNPYKDPKLTELFWTFEEKLMNIILLPRLFTRSATTARDRVGDAFTRYFANGHHKQGSLLVRNRWNVGFKNDIPLEDVARFEVAGSLAFLVNTVPAVFWLLYRVYSTPGLLNQIREELDEVIRTSNSPDSNSSDNVANTPTYSLDVTSIKRDCPLLFSTYQETMRLHTMGMSVRQVTEDTIFAGKYFLEKDAMIQMPTRVIHTDPQIWGPDVHDFRPERFLKTASKNTKKEKTTIGDNDTEDGAAANGHAQYQPKEMHFRSFGGGKTLCPGRHFATNEVMAVVGTFVGRFDMQPKGVDSGSGGDVEWKTPTAWSTSVASAVMTPDQDVEVEITTRKGYEDGKWMISLTDSDLVFALTTEDGSEK